MIHVIAYIIIFLWATWCVLSHHVKDGVLGKVMYSALSVAALSALIADTGLHAKSDTIIILCLAGIGIRHFTIKQWRVWQERKLTEKRR